MNTPRYSKAELVGFIANIEYTKKVSHLPESMENALTALGPFAKAVMVSAGPCLPTSAAIATGQSLDKVCDKMQAVYTAGTKRAPSVLDGVSSTYDELSRIPPTLRAAVKGCANTDLIRREDLEGKTLTALVKSGRTFVAIVSGGRHAVAVKRGKLYCTAGRGTRQKAMFVYEIV